MLTKRSSTSSRATKRIARCKSSRSELADELRAARKLNLLDVRTREEFDAVKIDRARIFSPRS